MTEFLLCMFANFNSTYMYNYFAWHFFFLRFRFALEMSFINVNSKNVSQTAHIKTHKSLDDEHTPGVFDVSLSCSFHLSTLLPSLSASAQNATTLFSGVR